MTNPDLPHLLEDSRRQIVAAAGGDDPVGHFRSALEGMFSAAENMLHEDPSGQRKLIACGPGCGYCCIVNVSVSIPEAFLIKGFLELWPEPELAGQKADLNQLWAVVRGLDDEERTIGKHACAFLGSDKNCRIYPVRPLLCRSITSTDVNQCRLAIEQQVFGTRVAVLMHRFQQQLYESLFTAVTAGLSEAGWDSRSFTLSGLMRYVLARDWAQLLTEKRYLAESRLTWNDLYP